MVDLIKNIYLESDSWDFEVVVTKEKGIYFMRLPYVITPSATFYVNGDRAEIERLLPHLPGLGKKIGAGGLIRNCVIEDMDEDYSLIKGDLAMRSLPLSLGYRGSEIMYLPWHAPYWAKNAAACVAPGAKVF